MADFDDSTVARFWAKVNKDGPVPEHMPHLGACWIWTASYRNNDGYGCQWVNGRTYRAPRLAWLIVNGTIPDGQCVLHHCDNRGCVRPSHLWLGSNAENVADREMKGRGRQPRGIANGTHTHPERVPRGSCHSFAKLTEDQVREIRRRAGNGEAGRALGREFGISSTNVSSIIRCETWKHVKESR